MKKVFAFFLCTVLLLGSFGSAALSPAAASADDSHAVKVIKALGLMDSENSVDFFENEPLTREDAVRYILKLKNVEISASGTQQYFKDVSPYDSSYALISTAVRLGIARGADSYFRPHDRVTGAEAAIMLLRAMGYDNLADPMGGTAVHYISLAQEYGFFKGVANYNGEITRGHFAKLLYNSFDIGIMEQTSFGENREYTVSKEKTSLSFLGLARQTGIVTENGVTSIYDTAEPAPAGNIIIGGTAYDVNNTNAASFLGYRTECYYYNEKGEEIPRIRYITAFENEELSLDLENGELSAKNGRLVYYDERTGRERAVEINPTTSIILNGKAVPYDPELLAGLPGTGKILLVNNKDREVTAKYGVAFVTSQVNDMVRSVDAANQKIYLKNTLIDGKPEIDLSDDYGEKQIRLSKDGKTISPADISTGSTITYVISADRKSITVTVSDKTQKGTIDGYDEEKNGNLVIAGVSYPLVSEFYARDKIVLGSTAVLYLNADGYAVDMEITLDKNYAYVCGVEQEEGIDESVRVKVFTANSSFSVMTLADKVTIYEGAAVLDPVTTGADGKEVRPFHPEEVSSRVTASEAGRKLNDMGKGMIVYNVNGSGLINELRFAIHLDPAETIPDPDDSAKKRTLVIPDLEYYENKFVLSKTLTASTQAGYGNIGGVGTSNTVIFSLPLKKDGSLDEEECRAAVNLLSTDKSYNNVQLFDAGIKGNAKVALMQQGVGSGISSPNQPLCIFSRTAQTVNKDGDMKQKVYYFKNGVEESVTLADTNTNMAWGSGKDIASYTFGDLFIYETNGAGELSVYSTIFDAGSLNKTVSEGSLISQGNGVGETREFQILCGTLRYSGTDAFTLAIDGNPKYTFYPLIANKDASAYRVKMERKTVINSDIGSIRTETFGSNPSRGERVLVRANRGNVQEVIVYE